jgi:hypothetical protein
MYNLNLLDKESYERSEPFYYAYLNQLLLWTTFADTLILASEDARNVIDSVSEKLLE